MSRAQDIIQICETWRGAYQVLITPTEDGVCVRMVDDHLGNPDLRFPPVYVSHKEFFELIPHNENTMETFNYALERGDTYGLFINNWALSRLSRKGVPNTATKYQHTLNRQEPTTDDFNHLGSVAGRV
jgi:hypothetical protein